MEQSPFYRGWHTALIIASGPSLNDEQLYVGQTAHAAGLCNVIVINDTWSRAPWADVLYACDGAWWRAQCHPTIAKLHDCKGMRNVDAVRARSRLECWTQDHQASVEFGLNYVPCVKIRNADGGLTDDAGAIHLAGNSGHQAINLAYLFGATRQLLIGFDMQRGAKTPQFPNGIGHWFGDHDRNQGLKQGDPASWIKSFTNLANHASKRGVSIVNCSAQSALNCFPRARLEDALTQRT